MRYTYSQYNAIIADVERTIKEAERAKKYWDDSGKKMSFHCEETDCSFCPFTYGNHVCPDIEMYYRLEIFGTERTADEWQSWLDEFMACNDPGRPYTVEIPVNAVDDIDTALNLGCVDTATAKLLESIQKQINDQNRN